MEKTNILVIDDDPDLIEFLKITFQFEGWKASAAKNAEEALRILGSNKLDMVLLDISMPGMNGLELLRCVIETYALPTIMLSGQNAIEIKVKCLEIGAEDFITKPFSPQELVTRINKILNRNFKRSLGLDPPQVFECEGLSINFNSREITTKGRIEKLTVIEYKILEDLYLSAGSILSYDYLLKKYWGSSQKSYRDALYVQIRHLRSKIERDANNPRYIINMPRTGYIFYKNGAA